jgi:hypothetical protein
MNRSRVPDKAARGRAGRESVSGGVPFEVPSQGFLLNLPALSAEDGQTGTSWLGVAPACSLDNTKWRGAVIYRSSDGVTFTEYAAMATSWELIVGYSDTTMHLHDEIVGLRAGSVDAVWRVAARGRIK